MSIVSRLFILLRIAVIAMLAWGAFTYQLTGYYTLLKWLVFISCIITTYKLIKEYNPLWAKVTGSAFMLATAVIFNPIMVIHLNSHALWAQLDFVAAFIILVSIVFVP